MYSKNGIKNISVTQLANILYIVSDKSEGRFFSFRVLCAFLAQEARHEATAASLKKAGHFVKEKASVTKTEIRALVGGDKSITAAFRLLEKRGVLSRVGDKISLTETPLPGTDTLLSILCGKDAFGYKRSVTRPVPIPRSWLERWAQPSRARVTQLLHFLYAGVLAYRSKSGAEIKTKGAFKFNKLSDALPINNRSLWHARKILVEEGRISEDQTFSQLVLNRRGHYVDVNLNWGKEQQAVENSLSPEAELQTPEQKPSSAAEPYRDNKHFVYRDQKSKSGVCKQTKKGEPHIRNMTKTDLKNARTLENLYHQAIQLKLIERSEAATLRFVAYAIRACELSERNPGGFMWHLLTKKCVGYITDLQEEKARSAINRFRNLGDSNYMRCAA